MLLLLKIQLIKRDLLFFWFKIKGLAAVTMLGKASFNWLNKPWFIDALIDTILSNPSIERCFFFSQLN